ncbi:MAG: cytidylate kinase-like family protein [Bacteroidales bacterium]|jgi:cytidylate kinase|nr:cytidylate kinase-like family protein [Bacteroidales bacterium]
MNTYTIINIGRQFGSGGHIIGQKLAKELDFAFYDKELITIAAKESGFNAQFFEKMDEKKKIGLFGGFFGLWSGSMADEYCNYSLSNESLFLIQSEVILKLASERPAIFVGRCADYILRDNPQCFNVFITSNQEDRIQRVMEREKLPRKKIISLIEKTDRNRAKYYNYFTDKTWGYAQSYHLCINSSLLGIEQTIQLIKQMTC